MNRTKLLTLSLLFASLSTTYGMDEPLTAEQLQKNFQVQQTGQQQILSVSNKRKLESGEEESPDSKRQKIEAISILDLPDEIRQIIINAQYWNFFKVYSRVCKAWKAESDKQVKSIRIKGEVLNYGLSRLLVRFPNVESLNLMYCSRITDDYLSTLTNLTGLSLASNEVITYKGVLSLTNLTRLDLCQNQKIEDGHLSTLTTLKSLSLSYNNTITIGGLLPLTKITDLSLGGYSKITDVDLLTLTNLRELNLGGNNTIRDPGLLPLTNLTSLILKDNSKITDAGVSTLTNLTFLDLDDNYMITNAGILTLTSLKTLYISNNHKIRDCGLAALPLCTPRR